MNTRFTLIPLLAVVAVLTGCQSGTTTTYHSPNSEMGRAIANLDNAEKLYNARVRAYQKAMMDYEAAHNGNGRSIFFSALRQPVEVVSPKVEIRNLQGAYKVGDYVDYKVRITYEDDAHLIVKQVEIMEKLAK